MVRSFRWPADLDAVIAGGKPVIARVLSALEADRMSNAAVALLDAAYGVPKAHVLGLTGPPGVGKSTLVQHLIARSRTDGKTVAVIAVDPSSAVTGGALLGDRTRLKTDPRDDGIFVRSMAARDRLGGLSADTVAATVFLQALYDRVIVESVGVGQSENDIGMVADTVLVCIQPGSGDSLQFMKAGIMEIPDIIAVTKADQGAAARRAVADVEGALSLSGVRIPVIAVSATTGEGLDALMAALALREDNPVAEDAMRHRARQWLEASVRVEHGNQGLARLAELVQAGALPTADTPFARERAALAAMVRS